MAVVLHLLEIGKKRKLKIALTSTSPEEKEPAPKGFNEMFVMITGLESARSTIALLSWYPLFASSTFSAS